MDLLYGNVSYALLLGYWSNNFSKSGSVQQYNLPN